MEILLSLKRRLNNWRLLRRKEEGQSKASHHSDHPVQVTNNGRGAGFFDVDEVRRAFCGLRENYSGAAVHVFVCTSVGTHEYVRASCRWVFHSRKRKCFSHCRLCGCNSFALHLLLVKPRLGELLCKRNRIPDKISKKPIFRWRKYCLSHADENI